MIARVVERKLRDTGLAAGRIVVGLSGGVDSVVLLHALVQLAPRLGVAPSALHVQHGLSPHAQDWASFCAGLCRGLGVPLREVRVKVDRGSKLGIEAAAREARYAVFRQQQAEAVALGHHLDDQAETLLLQLLRGAGVRGLSAMPAARVLEAGSSLRLVRPLLSVTRAQILTYAEEAGLSWVEDESNSDPAVDRSFLRARILPQLVERFPGLRDTLGRAAHNLADAALLLDDLATSDARGALAGDSLAVSALAGLSPARARNLLRWYLEQQSLTPPSRDQLEEALRQALAARGDARIQVKLGAAWLRRHRGRLYLEPSGQEEVRGWRLTWTGRRELSLPAGLSSIRFDPVHGAGLSLARLCLGEVVVRSRLGGERMRLAANRPSRTLKNLLQEAAVPEWERNRFPLVFAEDCLVWVPQVGMDHRYAAQAGEQGVLPQWVRS